MIEFLVSLDIAVKAFLTLCAAVGVLWGVRRKAWPRWKRIKTVIRVVVETQVGADPITDPVTGAVLKAATPGIGHRMATLEEAVSLMVMNNQRLGALEERVSVLESDRP